MKRTKTKIVSLVSLFCISFSVLFAPTILALETESTAELTQEQAAQFEEVTESTLYSLEEQYSETEQTTASSEEPLVTEQTTISSEEAPVTEDAAASSEENPVTEEESIQEVVIAPDSTDTSNELESDAYLHDVEPIFFLPNGETLVSERGTPETIEVTTSLPTKQIRITLPVGAYFSESNSGIEFEEIEDFGELGIAYMATYESEQKAFAFDVTFTTPGYAQLTVEDYEGGYHSVFLFTYTTDGSRESVTPQFDRTSVSVTTYSNFRSAWNNGTRTEIMIGGVLESNGAVLNNRASGVALVGSHSSSVLKLTSTQAVPWASGTVSVRLLEIQGGVFNGATLDMQRDGSIQQTLTNGGGSIQVQNLTMNTTGSTQFVERYTIVSLANSVRVTNNLTITRGSMETMTTVIVGNTATLHEFSLRQMTSSLPALSARTVQIRDGLVSWDFGNMSNTANVAWDPLTATIVNNSITASSDSTFNDSSFQLNRARRLRSYGFADGGTAPPVNPPIDPPPIDPDPDPDPGPNPVDPPIDPGLIGQPARVTAFFIDSETDRDIFWRSYSGVVGTALTIAAAQPGGELEQTFPGYEFSTWTTEEGTPLSATWGRYYPTTQQFIPYHTNVFLLLYYDLQDGTVTVKYVSEEGEELAPTETLTGKIRTAYQTQAKEITGWNLLEIPSNAQGQFAVDPITVNYVYEPDEDEDEEVSGPLPPVDPLEPEVEVNPNDRPDIPEDQGLLSLDFVSNFRFGTQEISGHTEVYNATPQRLLTSDGNEEFSEERPNYVQISDRRKMGGWELSVVQTQQFTNTNDRELFGASLILRNQEAVTVQGGTALPARIEEDIIYLVPEASQPLMASSETEDDGRGTWIYRFGDEETAGESVQLEVPSIASPEVSKYQTTLVWELRAVPE